MKDDYDQPAIGAVPEAAAPGSSTVAADGALRSIDRRIVIGLVAGAVVVGSTVAYTLTTTRQSMLTPTASAAVPSTLRDGQSLALPSAPSPTPPPRPPVQRTMRPMTPAPIAYVPPAAPAAAAVTARTPSPEAIWAEDERRRILETRRASSRVQFADGGLAQQTARDTRDLAQGSQMPVAGNGPHRQFLGSQRGVVGYIAPQSRYQINRGTIINARWETTLDSTLPGGTVKAKVDETIMDSRTDSVPVLVPGSILTGTCDSQAFPGEARALCVFDEVEMPKPDSRRFFMGANNAAGQQGENGASVGVDTHAGRTFGNAFLYSILQAGVNVASRASTVVNLDGTTSQVFQTPQRSAPTFHAYVGQPLTIVVAQDLPLDRFEERAP
jgi:type IV secretory pathway VirB10-like protein